MERDIGKFDCLPIDVHEKRFLVRTGIFQYFLGEKINDVTKDEHFAEVLRRFSDYLKKNFGDKIEKIKLRDREYDPTQVGILDMFIWYHCAKENKENDKNIGGRGICGEKPKCKDCLLRKSCLTGIKIVN